MENARGAATPMDVHAQVDLAKHRTEREADPVEYQAIVGSPMYIALPTRPGISFAVSALSRYSSRLGFSSRQLTTAYISAAKATARSQATRTPIGRTTAQTANRKAVMCSFYTTVPSHGIHGSKT